MAKELLMPRQGNTVESCLILEWKKREGEPIESGEIICEVETDKAAFELESEESGTVLKILYEEGADVPVLTPIAIIGEPGEDISKLIPMSPVTEQAEPSSMPEKYVSQQQAEPVQVAIPAPTPTSQPLGISGISPRARHLAAAKGIKLSGVTGSGPEGRIIERDVLNRLSAHEPLTPAAISTMITQGLYAPAVGTGIGGRVTTKDLQQAEQPAIPPSGKEEFPGLVTEIPVKGVRKIIAGRMLESLQTTAQLTLNTSADASMLLAYRKRLKASPEEFGLTHITINDLILYAAAKMLPRFRSLNAHFLGETIQEFDRVHLGMAVDSPRGLMVPVLKQADCLSLNALSKEAKRLSTACREGTILPDELSGATFTMTNLGALGIESFTPVLNPPEVAILGVCAIQPKPVMAEDDVRFVPHIGLSLTFDHRAVDGAPAARFLKELCTALTNIDLLLAG